MHQLEASMDSSPLSRPVDLPMNPGLGSEIQRVLTKQSIPCEERKIAVHPSAPMPMILTLQHASSWGGATCWQGGFLLLSVLRPSLPNRAHGCSSDTMEGAARDREVLFLPTNP